MVAEIIRYNMDFVKQQSTGDTRFFIYVARTSSSANLQTFIFTHISISLVRAACRRCAEAEATRNVSFKIDLCDEFIRNN